MNEEKSEEQTVKIGAKSVNLFKNYKISLFHFTILITAADVHPCSHQLIWEKL